MRVDVTLYKDEFNTHKQLNAVVLEQVLKELPAREGIDEEKLAEERAARFDTLFEEIVEKIEVFLAADLKRSLKVVFEPELTISHFNQ